MIRFGHCVRRRPDVAPATFKKYSLENHGPQARSFAQAWRTRKCVQSYKLDTELKDYAPMPRANRTTYDGITEVRWDRAEDVIAAGSTPAGQSANRTLAEAGGRFCNRPNCSVFFTEEPTVFDL